VEGNFLNAFNLDFLMTPPKEHLNTAAEHSVEPKTNITAEELNLLPLKAFTGKVSVITDAEKLSKALKEMEKHDAVGFDTETRPSFKKGQSYNVALLQLALPHKVFLIRLHHTGVTDELAAFFENENIIKAGVAIRDDIKALQKNKRFQPQAFVELATLSKEKGLQVESVKKLTGLLLGFRISKSAQTSNWEAPTLTEKQLEYAATDAWVCLEIYKKLIAAQPVTIL
jgi:ribonuclease D